MRPAARSVAGPPPIQTSPRGPTAIRLRQVPKSRSRATTTQRGGEVVGELAAARAGSLRPNRGRLASSVTPWSAPVQGGRFILPALPGRRKRRSALPRGARGALGGRAVSGTLAPLRPPRRSLGAIRAGLLLAAQAACLAAQVPPPRIQLPPKKAPVFPVIAMAPQAVAAGKALARLDVRGAREYAAGHAPGAVRLDLGEIARACPEPEPVCLRAALGSAGVSAAAPVVLFAADLETAARAFFLLEAAGCRIVRIAGGGFSAWQAAKMPVERRARKASPQPFGAPAERIAVLEA